MIRKFPWPSYRRRLDASSSDRLRHIQRIVGWRSSIILNCFHASLLHVLCMRDNDAVEILHRLLEKLRVAMLMLLCFSRLIVSSPTQGGGFPRRLRGLMIRIGEDHCCFVHFWRVSSCFPLLGRFEVRHGGIVAAVVFLVSQR